MQTFAGFSLEAVLGEGTMGEVWRARASDGTLVAIKVARRKVLADLRLLKLMDAEARAMARLDHPSIAWVYDYGRAPVGGPFEPGAPYLVLEHCGGGTLANRKISRWEEVSALAVLLLDALAHAHAHNVIHRDLKPANILWSSPADVRPGPKIADFGIAFAAEPALTEPSAAGTPWYMAPEQFSKESPLGAWTDLYSLGVVLWELVTGAPPYRAPEAIAAILAARAGRLPTFRPLFSMPQGALPWLERLLARHPKDRFRCAADALRALAKIDPSVSPPAETWQSPARTGPRLQLQGAGLALLASREPEIVGRHREREAAWRCLQQSISQRGVEVLLVRGVSGIGKTRLLSWLSLRALELGLASSVSVACQASSPLRSMLAGLLRCEGRAATQSGDIARHLAELGLPQAVTERIDELLQGPHTRWGVVPAVRQALLTLVSAPRLLLFDDAHASESALRFARALQAERPQVPLMIALAVDEDALEETDLRPLVDALQASASVRTIHLGPLSSSEQEQLSDLLVGLSPVLRSELMTSAAGHPGYLVSKVAALASSGALVAEPGGFVRAYQEEPFDPIRVLWERRLDHLLSGLPRASVVALQRAAVFGRDVDEELWEGACDDPAGTGDHTRFVPLDLESLRARLSLVARLVASGVARETDTGFAFAHPSLVEALIQRAQKEGTLADHHRAAAAQIRWRRMPEHALMLGFHLAEAGDYEPALDALVDGIDWAWTRADRRPLLSELRRAERCAEVLGLPDDDPRRIRLHLLRSVLMLGLGRMEEARVACLLAVELAEKRKDMTLLARAVMRMGDILPLLGDWASAKPWFIRFLELEAHAEKRAWGGIARARLGNLAHGKGEPEAARWFAEAERILSSCDPSDPQVISGFVELYGFSEQYEKMLVATFSAERLLAAAGRPTEQAYVLYRRHEALSLLDRYDDAVIAIERAIALSDQMGDARASVSYRGQLANAALAHERYEQAHAVAEEALARAVDLRNAWLEAFLSILDLQALVALGHNDAVDRRLERLRAVVPHVPWSEGQIRAALAEMADALRARGEGARAERFEAVITAAHSQAGPPSEVLLHVRRDPRERA